MISQYSVAFLLPKKSAKFLGNDGWEFKSNYKVPEEVRLLIEENLSITTSPLDGLVYSNESLKLNLFEDRLGRIENIYFRFYNGLEANIPDFLEEIVISDELDFFIPK